MQNTLMTYISIVQVNVGYNIFSVCKDGSPRLIHCPRRGIPLPFDAHIRPVRAPAAPQGELAAVPCRLQPEIVFYDLALDGCVVARRPVLLHELFDVPIAQGICQILAYAHQNDIRRKIGPLKAIAIVPLTLLLS